MEGSDHTCRAGYAPSVSRLVGVRFLPPLQIDRRALRIDLVFLRVALPGLVGLAVSGHVGLLSRIVEGGLSRIVFN